jgi:hypothetical protein
LAVLRIRIFGAPTSTAAAGASFSSGFVADRVECLDTSGKRINAHAFAVAPDHFGAKPALDQSGRP